MAFILAIDQGTTATKSMIIDSAKNMLAVSAVTHPQHYPQPGWVEHDADEIKHSVRQSVRNALKEAQLDAGQITAIGITNQRETLCLFDQSNRALLPFIVWQCRRSSEICERLKKKGLGDYLHQLTGLHLDPYFSASKLLWVFEHYPELKQLAEKGELLVGTIDSFLSHWFSEGALHITDVTNASRTMLMDLKTCQWSKDALQIFSVPERCLPHIHKSIGPYGTTKGLDFLPDGIPLAALAGDQQAALFGQGCFDVGMAKATFGTGCFILQNTGTSLIHSQHGLVSSVAYQIDEKPRYCLEGSAFVAGAAVQFLIDAFGLIKDPQELELLAAQVSSSEGVIFVPALCGLGAPYWHADARGAFFGLSRGTNRSHIARAVLEGIALQNTDIITAMAKDAFKFSELKVDGGAASDLLMQIQADLLGISCTRSKSTHQTTLGIAMMAGLAIGVFNGIAQLRSFQEPGTVFVPSSQKEWGEMLIAAYKNALLKLL